MISPALIAALHLRTISSNSSAVISGLNSLTVGFAGFTRVATYFAIDSADRSRRKIASIAFIVFTYVACASPFSTPVTLETITV